MQEPVSERPQHHQHHRHPQQQFGGHGDSHAHKPGYGGQRGARGQWAGPHSDTASLGRDQAHSGGGGKVEKNFAGRRQKHYRKLWEHVKSVHAGDTDGGRHLPSEMSVEDLVKVCASLPPDASAVATVSSALAYLDSRAMAALMKELAKCHALPRAMELFDWLRSQPPEHELHALCDVYTFTTAISLMGSSQQLRRALELVGEMRARGLQANVHTYSALMNVCIKCDACDLALDVFGQMREDKIRPNVVTYNTLVDVYGKTGQWEKAVCVLDDMRKEGLEPEVRTFNTAIIACNMCGQPHEALKVYQKLLDCGLQPIATTYTALISAYGKAGQLDKALDTFQAMIYHGCERSVITYSSLISACEKAGKWELALQLFEQMQREGCAPNTVTYNSLITACQQGGQPDKACEVFEQMKYHGCRPDVVTYSALIAAHNKAGQWQHAVRAFEAMHAAGCKPDSLVYQNLIDSLWRTGLAWAQGRAWQLYLAAARNWQYRFTVQVANSSSPVELEYVLPACTPGVAVLALRRWLYDLVGQAEADAASLLGGTRERLVLSLGRSRQVKEPGSTDTAAALTALLQAYGSPFRPGSGTTAPGNAVVAEADMLAALDWLRSPELPELLALLVPPSAASRQPSPLGGPGPASKRVSMAPELADDAKLADSCGRAFATVLEYEAELSPHAMVPEYLDERRELIGVAFRLATEMELPDEVVFDGVLLMDRVMSTGAAHDPALGSLFVAAALRLAALQTVAGSDADGAANNVPTDALLTAATGFPEGSVSKMEDNISTALGGATKSISLLRSFKLFLERMGADSSVQQEVPAAAHFNNAMPSLLRAVLSDPLVLNWRPAVAAAATLVAARAAVGCHPFHPGCLQELTHMGLAGARSSSDGSSSSSSSSNEEGQQPSELAAAVAAVKPLAAAAGLRPPPRATPIPHFGGAHRPLPGGHLFGHQFGTPTFGSMGGSGYSTPASLGDGTPTAAAAAAMAAAQMQFGGAHHHKSLLDAVVRQHSALHHRAGSDLSSLSVASGSDVGSAADLQALLSASALASGMAGSPLGSGPRSGGFMGPAASEPVLAAAMAGLQLGVMQGGGGGSSHGSPQMPWLGQGGGYGGSGSGGGGLDPYHHQHGFVPPPPPHHHHQQQQNGSRLAQMTNPYVTPGHMQQAMMFSNNAAQLLR